jgi:hypothetical protein
LLFEIGYGDGILAGSHRFAPGLGRGEDWAKRNRSAVAESDTGFNAGMTDRVPAERKGRPEASYAAVIVSAAVEFTTHPLPCTTSTIASSASVPPGSSHSGAARTDALHSGQRARCRPWHPDQCRFAWTGARLHPRHRRDEMKRHVDSSVSAQPNRNKYRACRGIRMNLNAAVVQVHSRRRLTGVVISHRPASSRCGVQTYEQRERRTRTGHVRQWRPECAAHYPRRLMGGY